MKKKYKFRKPANPTVISFLKYGKSSRKNVGKTQFLISCYTDDFFIQHHQGGCCEGVIHAGNHLFKLNGVIKESWHDDDLSYADEDNVALFRHEKMNIAENIVYPKSL